ncbi:MAG TPA: hypothetical protein H9743_00555 [Candidatus Mediterraneibacter vanvlietii]|nr:hypothetical protein [Candidatus Mediterraneibacter vanvlietii]
MKQISGFSTISINGGTRVSYTYDEIDGTTGELKSQNIKKSFYVVDPDMLEHINAIFENLKAREE